MRPTIPVLLSLATLSTVNMFCELFNNCFVEEERRSVLLPRDLELANWESVCVYVFEDVCAFVVYK